ncbi:DUF308 domain-containing protein [Candidatus Saccharibacteria bacterium]|nr:DUF308 domain-containing protein [Candidatus Saccharibacteria bacterium]
MANIRRYIESHWLIYAFQGLVSLLFGWFVMFTGIKDVPSLMAVVGTTLLCLGIIEVFNLLHRKHYGGSLAISLIMAISEIVIAILLLVTLSQDIVWQLVLVAIYTIGRGILEILLAFLAITDKTDKFMWVVCGICGCVIGVVILNSGSFVDSTTFIKFFGTYMMIYGITNLIYGIHNKNELTEQIEEAAKKRKLRSRLRLKLGKKSEKKQK